MNENKFNVLGLQTAFSILSSFTGHLERHNGESAGPFTHQIFNLESNIVTENYDYAATRASIICFLFLFNRNKCDDTNFFSTYIDCCRQIILQMIKLDEQITIDGLIREHYSSDICDEFRALFK